MTRSATSTVGRENLRRRIADLYAGDLQFACAAPLQAVADAIKVPDLPLVALMRKVLDGYANRPALGRRVATLHTDPLSGRTSVALQPRFETITYAQLSERVAAIATALSDEVDHGDRICILGFPSVDYVTVDLATIWLGAVSVPLTAGTPVAQLRPIVAETEPTIIASSIEYLASAVDLALVGPTPKRLIVFDFHLGDDDHHEAFEAARERLPATSPPLTLADLMSRATTLPAVSPFASDDPERLTALIYTSGTTGTPKGAMHPQRMAAGVGAWRRSIADAQSELGALPWITLNFLPLSHILGRSLLYGTLGAGGTAYFAAKSDLSTFLEDLALVRPTRINFVPRIWESIHSAFLTRLDHDRANEVALTTEFRTKLLGGRYVSAMSGSAPLSPKLRAWAEGLLDMHLTDSYGSTETGPVVHDGKVARPPVIDYRLVDVPELGYFGTDRPYPRGELLLKSATLFAGYYKRPDVTAVVFDEEGYYRTGDIVAELAPDRLRFVERRNSVLKLSQGEFVSVAKLEAAFRASPLVRQIFVYGSSSRPYVLAVVVPSEDALASGGDLEARIAKSLRVVAKSAGLRPYETPRSLLIEATPFTLENGLLTGTGKMARPKLNDLYGQRLERRYTELAKRRESELQVLRLGASEGREGAVVDTISRAAAALLDASDSEVSPDASFADLGGDSLSALTFAGLLNEVFGIDVPVSVIVSPATDLASLAVYIEAERRHTGSKRPTFATVHGSRATELHASDLTLGKFIDAATLAAAPSLPSTSQQIRTVLLTGATGFLGRYLALEWLGRMDLVDGKVICLVRASDDDAARQRLDDIFSSGDGELLRKYQTLAPDHLEVLAGDKVEANLKLDQRTWQRLADTVDLIVDCAALVNHVLPYSELFPPNVFGTAELLRIALTTKRKPYIYTSTMAVGAAMPSGFLTEEADIRVVSATRHVDDSYANGYANSKWAGEVLLSEAHDLCDLPVSVFRCNMILADTTYTGQLNLPGKFTRLMLSLLATGIAPGSFYELDANGHRQRAHFDGLPVTFHASAIAAIGTRVAAAGFETYNAVNPHDDGVGLDEYVDWLIDAGYDIRRIDDYATWVSRFESAIRALPHQQRQVSVLPLLHDYQRPQQPVRGATAPAKRFRTAVRDAGIEPDKDIPRVTRDIIVRYANDFQLLGLL